MSEIRFLITENFPHARVSNQRPHDPWTANLIVLLGRVPVLRHLRKYLHLKYMKIHVYAIKRATLLEGKGGIVFDMYVTKT